MLALRAGVDPQSVVGTSCHINLERFLQALQLRLIARLGIIKPDREFDLEIQRKIMGTSPTLSLDLELESAVLGGVLG